VPAIDTATSLGNAKAANMVMLGALAACSELISRSALEQISSKGSEARRERSIKALERGFETARRQTRV
jgi:Pyruvate/2-oxoacid:ferredoxin oxidoreductase gamma subunit